MAIRVVHCGSMNLPPSALVRRRREPDAGNSTDGNNDPESKLRRYDLSATRNRRPQSERIMTARCHANMTAKPKYIAPPCIDIRRLPPDNGGRAIFGR